MPFKSVKQARKFALLMHQGKISKKTFDEWASHTKFSTLPLRAKKGKIKK